MNLLKNTAIFDLQQLNNSLELILIWNFYLWFGSIQCSPVMDLSNIYLVEYRLMYFKRHQESRTIGWSNDNIFCICFIIWRNFRFSLITISTRPVVCAQTLSPTRCSVPKILITLYFRDRNKHIRSILCRKIEDLLTKKLN